MSSIKYIIGQYTRVNSFIHEFTREYCPITYTCNIANIEIKDKINRSHGFINYQLAQYLRLQRV